MIVHCRRFHGFGASALQPMIQWINPVGPSINNPLPPLTPLPPQALPPSAQEIPIRAEVGPVVWRPPALLPPQLKPTDTTPKQDVIIQSASPKPPERQPVNVNVTVQAPQTAATEAPPMTSEVQAAKSGGSNAALIAGLIGGFLVAGPVGAAVGAAVGAMAGKRKTETPAVPSAEFGVLVMTANRRRRR